MAGNLKTVPPTLRNILYDSEVRLAREMSFMDATLIGVGAMIGAGIFVLIGIAADVAGPGLILTFSLYALGFGAYFEHVLREFSITMPQWGLFSSQKILAAGIAILFAYVNYRGASETGKLGILLLSPK